jgi:hypothetical protein
MVRQHLLHEHDPNFYDLPRTIRPILYNCPQSSSIVKRLHTAKPYYTLHNRFATATSFSFKYTCDPDEFPIASAFYCYWSHSWRSHWWPCAHRCNCSRYFHLPSNQTQRCTESSTSSRPRLPSPNIHSTDQSKRAE